MSASTIINAALALASPWPIARVMAYLLPGIGIRYDIYIGWGGAGIGGGISAVQDRQWLQAGAFGLNAVAALICWWWSRRKRKRSPKLIGAKSRALLAAVVARMRETAKPRQVLRPVPGGSGA